MTSWRIQRRLRRYQVGLWQPTRASQQQLTTAPVLAYPDFTQPFTLDTDANRDGIGAVLSQVNKQGHKRVVAYSSCLLSKAEHQCCVTCRELLGYDDIQNQFRPYLTDPCILIPSDHGFKPSRSLRTSWHDGWNTSMSLTLRLLFYIHRNLLVNCN